MTDSNKSEALRKELLDLDAKRKKIEEELMMNKIVLEQNKVGMNDRLTDAEDFPRNDIDVYAVRHARSKIVTLENDLKQMVNSLQSKLEELHSLTKPNN